LRKIFSFIATSLDGYYAGPNGELDWQNLDDEFDRYSIEQLAEVDTLLFGRVTYEGMVAYWPTELGRQYNSETALKLVKTKTFGSGGILAYYQPVSAQSGA
jgi:dihydrofolate reductase